MKVVVRTYCAKTGKFESERTVNYDRASHRQWLAKHCLWAYNNGKGIQSLNARDDEAQD